METRLSLPLVFIFESGRDALRTCLARCSAFLIVLVLVVVLVLVLVLVFPGYGKRTDCYQRPKIENEDEDDWGATDSGVKGYRAPKSRGSAFLARTDRAGARPYQGSRGNAFLAGTDRAGARPYRGPRGNAFLARTDRAGARPYQGSRENAFLARTDRAGARPYRGSRRSASLPSPF